SRGAGFFWRESAASKNAETGDAGGHTSVDSQQLCARAAGDVDYAGRPEHRGRRESIDGDTRCGADQRGRSGDRWTAGRCRKDFFNDGGAASKCAADLAVVFAE